MKRHVLAATAAAGLVLAATTFAVTAFAQPKATPTQVVTPPKASYWVSATTGSGLMGLVGAAPKNGKVGMMDGLRMARQMAAGGGVSHQLELDLGSTLAPTGAPEAAHTGPAGLGVRGALPLETPKPVTSAPPEPREEQRGEPKRPKGRLLLFWGCGEHARAGQPVIIDFSKMSAGQMPAGLASLSTATVSAPKPPSEATSRTYGRWPNAIRPNGDAQITSAASLLGDHSVRGTYTPDIRFTANQDFLAPVTFTTNAKAPSGAVTLVWAPVAAATGYAGWTFGGNGEDLVFWSSSESKTFGAFEAYLPPSEAARLVRERVLMAPSTTTCAVPAEAIQAMGANPGQGAGPEQGAGPGRGGGILFFTAYGPEQNVIYPERPADPRTPWNQEWAVKVRYRSATMQMLGQNMGAQMAADGRAASPDGPACPPATSMPNVGEMIGGATGIPGAGMLGGALGRMGKKKQETPANPNCPH